MCLCFGFCAFFWSWCVNLGRVAAVPAGSGWQCGGGLGVPVLWIGSFVHPEAQGNAPSPQPCATQHGAALPERVPTCTWACETGARERAEMGEWRG